MLSIALDLDGVIRDFEGHLTYYLKNIVKPAVNLINPSEYSLYKKYDNADAVKKVLLEKAEYIFSLAYPYKDAITFANILISLYKVDIVTAPYNIKCIPANYYWVSWHELAPYAVINEQNKHNLFYKYWIEDSPDQIKNIRARHKDAIIIGIKRSWNEGKIENLVNFYSNDYGKILTFIEGVI